MTEISKMFENAGFLKKQCKDYSCTVCEQYNECSKYPPFTAGKQIEIVKFMLHKGVYYDTDGDTYWFHCTDEIENTAYRPFEEAIAEFINTLWQDLTNQEKEGIRRILNE